MRRQEVLLGAGKCLFVRVCVFLRYLTGGHRKKAITGNAAQVVCERAMHIGERLEGI